MHLIYNTSANIVKHCQINPNEILMPIILKVPETFKEATYISRNIYGLRTYMSQLAHFSIKPGLKIIQLYKRAAMKPVKLQGI